MSARKGRAHSRAIENYSTQEWCCCRIYGEKLGGLGHALPEKFLKLNFYWQAGFWFNICPHGDMVDLEQQLADCEDGIDHLHNIVHEFETVLC